MKSSGERLIRLDTERRADGMYLISSQDLPLLHLAIESIDQVETIVFPILKDTIERKIGVSVTLRLIDLFNIDETTGQAEVMSAHVIARTAA